MIDGIRTPSSQSLSIIGPGRKANRHTEAFRGTCPSRYLKYHSTLAGGDLVSRLFWAAPLHPSTAWQNMKCFFFLFSAIVKLSWAPGRATMRIITQFARFFVSIWPQKHIPLDVIQCCADNVVSLLLAGSRVVQCQKNKSQLTNARCFMFVHMVAFQVLDSSITLLEQERSRRTKVVQWSVRWFWPQLKCKLMMGTFIIEKFLCAAIELRYAPGPPALFLKNQLGRFSRALSFIHFPVHMKREHCVNRGRAPYVCSFEFPPFLPSSLSRTHELLMGCCQANPLCSLALSCQWINEKKLILNETNLHVVMSSVFSLVETTLRHTHEHQSSK